MDILSLISSGAKSEPSDPSGSLPLSSGHVVLLHPSWNVFDSTKLKTFSVCMRKGFLQYILGWDTDYKNHDFIFGEAGHLAHAHIIENGYNVKSIEEAFSLFIQRYRKDFDPITDSDFHPKSPHNFMEGLLSYATSYRGDKYNVLYTEVVDSIPISDKHKIYFRIDALLEWEGAIWAREKKFSKWKTTNWGDSWQLSIQPLTYNHVLRCIAGDRIVKGVEMDGTFFYKNDVTHERSWVNPSNEEMEAWRLDILSLIEDIYRNIEILRTESPSNPGMKSFRKNTEACFAYYNKKCPYFNICNGCSNPLRLIEQNDGNPPSGFIRKFWDPTNISNFKPLPILNEPEDKTLTQILKVEEQKTHLPIFPISAFSCSSCGTSLFGRGSVCRDCQTKRN